MASPVQSPRGTNDVLPNDSYRWQYVEKIMREICEKYGFSEIRTPVFEHTELFSRGVGETTDIVSKEMYTMTDKGGRSITLRPEGTAGVVRSFIQHGILKEVLPVRTYYLMSCFRYEKPQAGRIRQHHQLGTEIFGAPLADADAEIIILGKEVIETFGIKNSRLEINSVGCSKCKDSYHKALKMYFNKHIEELCGTCKERLDRNPLRILDCKSSICQGITKDAPKTIDYLCEECENHFDSLKEILAENNISFTVNPRIVRGQDYYSKTVFELIHTDTDGKDIVLCGGGRYDRLVEFLGGDYCPGIGFGMGIERILMVMESEGVTIPEPNSPTLFLASIGEKGRKKVRGLCRELQKENLFALYDLNERSLKAQLKYADKLNTKWLLVIGDGECESNKAVIRNMNSKEEREVELIAQSILKGLKD